MTWIFDHEIRYAKPAPVNKMTGGPIGAGDHKDVHTCVFIFLHISINIDVYVCVCMMIHHYLHVIASAHTNVYLYIYIISHSCVLSIYVPHFGRLRYLPTYYINDLYDISTCACMCKHVRTRIFFTSNAFNVTSTHQLHTSVLPQSYL